MWLWWWRRSLFQRNFVSGIPSTTESEADFRLWWNRPEMLITQRRIRGKWNCWSIKVLRIRAIWARWKCCLIEAKILFEFARTLRNARQMWKHCLSTNVTALYHRRSVWGKCFGRNEILKFILWQWSDCREFGWSWLNYLEFSYLSLHGSLNLLPGINVNFIKIVPEIL